ncbi:MAG: hypothetical protein NT113_15640, partial [Hyphomicrobiales bacterium]|nr:hypothetical protein [Hyphomicrobiales bacterium]
MDIPQKIAPKRPRRGRLYSNSSMRERNGTLAGWLWRERALIPTTVIARSEATKQSSVRFRLPGLLRFARNDGSEANVRPSIRELPARLDDRR